MSLGNPAVENDSREYLLFLWPWSEFYHFRVVILINLGRWEFVTGNHCQIFDQQNLQGKNKHAVCLGNKILQSMSTQKYFKSQSVS